MTSKEHPILFNADMVRAILDGRKTQTRRPVPYQVGSLLWVRESYWHQRLMVESWYLGHYVSGEYIDAGYDWEFAAPWMADTKPGEAYAEDFGPLEKHLAYGDEEPVGDNWERRPSIRMPRWASRITLEVTAVWDVNPWVWVAEFQQQKIS